MSMKHNYRQADHCDACKLKDYPCGCSEQDQRINPWYLCDEFVSKYTRKQSEVVILQAQLATARQQLIEYEETETAVCPEDVGIQEYVKSLQAENKRLREALKQVKRYIKNSEIYTYNQGEQTIDAALKEKP